MKNSRTVYAAKNFIYSTAGNLCNSILSFISRTVFIYVLGTVYLGINGLLTNVLGMLSLAELGVGAAISFSLYKPLAENDIHKIQAIINFYRTAYRIIAGIVAIVGIIIAPFLKYMIHDANGISNIQIYYFVFLFNTVSSYLITYKSTLLSADQRNYLITNINTVVKMITTIIQIIVLLLFKNFMLYLIIGAVIQLSGNIYLNYFTDKQFPYIKGKNSEKLSKNDKKVIFTKIKALIFHKIGEVSIYQTDNIITSAFININTVGLVSNFTMIINIVNNFIMSFFNSATAGLGNLIATEGDEKKILISKRYDFLGFVFFGWSSIFLYFLLGPFISIWIGKDKLIDTTTITLLCINYYLTGIRVPLTNVKTAAGVYEQDQWVPLVQSLLNIIISIIGAKYMGLKGIYIGTLLSSLIPSFVRPYIVYKHVFHVSCKKYFLRYFTRIIEIIVCIGVIKLILIFVNINNIFFQFAFIIAVCIMIPCLLLVLIFRNTDEFQYIKSIVTSLIVSVKKLMNRNF